MQNVIYKYVCIPIFMISHLHIFQINIFIYMKVACKIPPILGVVGVDLSGT